jgi:hypothetical protein
MLVFDAAVTDKVVLSPAVTVVALLFTVLVIVLSSFKGLKLMLLM